MMSDLVCL